MPSFLYLLYAICYSISIRNANGWHAQDNRDPEAFLKPVNPKDYPDYLQIIPRPMDLSTISKKVKSKSYRSKKEFQDDLELIWSNCERYNQAPGHPLRACARRLREKAEVLVGWITDKKDRGEVGAQQGVGGEGKPEIGKARIKIAGSSSRSTPTLASVTASASLGMPAPVQAVAPLAPPPLIKLESSRASTPAAAALAATKKEIPFPETPALVRTAEGMRTFASLDAVVDRALGGAATAPESSSMAFMRELVLAQEEQRLVEWEGEEGEGTPLDGGDVGSKRRLLVSFSSLSFSLSFKNIDILMILDRPNDPRPRKRPRLSPSDLPYPLSTLDPTELWWKAVETDPLLASGLPLPPYQPPRAPRSAFSNTSPDDTPTKVKKPAKIKTKVKSKGKEGKEGAGKKEKKTLLALMNKNIVTMRSLRRVHLRYSALEEANKAEEGGEDEAGAGAGKDVASGAGKKPSVFLPPPGGGGGGGIEDLIPDTKVDKRSWYKRAGVRRGAEVGEEQAEDCVRWMGGKVLEHVGFQGTLPRLLNRLRRVID